MTSEEPFIPVISSHNFYMTKKASKPPALLKSQKDADDKSLEACEDVLTKLSDLMSQCYDLDSSDLG